MWCVLVCVPVRVLLIDAIEELQKATADIARDFAHHAKVIVYEAAPTSPVHCYVAGVRICNSNNDSNNTNN